ncbi:MAG TPA: acyl-CoA dehydrogenase family protein, partial [Gaiellaceae bacterium]|nr:acyl-CoA dehydrogenase family protein [Gaiellaceae bacterium]
MERLQQEIRAFLAAERPDVAGLPHALDERIKALRAWQARCHRAGYVGRAWPTEYGGGGAPAVEQIVIDQELAAAGAPEFANVVGLDVLGPSLLRFGSDEQRRRYLP